MIVVTATQMQAMDRQTIEDFGIPGRVLMESAGRGAVRCFMDRVWSSGFGSVGIIAGRGNNGGDGFVIARYLKQSDIDVRVYLLADQDIVQGDAASNLNLLPKLGIPVTTIADEQSFIAHQTEMSLMDSWVDAIFGTGLNADVRGYFKQVIEFINAQRRPVFAVDIPSGLNADTGQPCGICIQAQATATFGFAKIGHLVYPGTKFCGDVEVIDIGIPRVIAEKTAHGLHMITGEQIAAILPRRDDDAHKGDTGHVLVIAGGPGKTGAAVMTSMTALRSGAGLATLGIPKTLNSVVEAQMTEAMTLPLPDSDKGLLTVEAYDLIVQAAEGKQCIAIGPGMGTASATAELVRRVADKSDLPIVIDADGLNNLAGHLDLLTKRSAPTVLTPHPGEMARLLDITTAQIQQDRIAAARTLAQQYHVHVVLKGARTLVAAPDGQVWINTTGNAGMASGGMGDVLTGLIAGLLAQGCPVSEAAIAGVYLHGLAADILSGETPWGYLATEVMHTLPEAIVQVRTNPPAAPVKQAWI